MFRIIFLVLAFGLFSCAESVQTTSSGKLDRKVERSIVQSVRSTQKRDNRFEARFTGRKAISRGNDTFINEDALEQNSASSVEIISAGKDKVEMNLVNASISAAAQAVLGDALKVPFIVADEVRGSVTVQTTGPIPKNALLDLFKASLEVNNARIEKDGSAFKIVPGRAASRRFVSTSQASSASGKAIVVAPLKYISATQMLQLLKPSVDDGLRVDLDKKRNLLLLSGSKDQLNAALEALNVFDVDIMRGKSIALVNLEAADPESVVSELEQIFETGPGGSLEDVVQFIPNSRLRSILIITSRSKYLADAQKWIRDLDRSAGGVKRYSQIYELQNRSADELAPVLANLLGVEAKANASDSQKADAEDEFDREFLSLAIDELQILSDDAQNSIVARALKSEHEEIKRLINTLDRAQKQVLLEATLAEVTLNDELNLGVRWFFEKGNGSGTFSDVVSGAVSSNFPGFSAIFSNGGTKVALNALSSVTDVKIISTPTLTVLDNKEAELRIGDQVPIATRSAVDTTNPNAPVVSNIDYRDTGVILKVRPRIGNGGRVVMQIEQEVSNVAQTTSSGIDSPTIRQRQIKTSVVVDNGNTLALGGIIQERDNKTRSQVPGLGDVPVLGALFRNKNKTANRTELLILIRPWVMNDSSDSRAVTDYWRKKMNGPNKILATGLGNPRHTLSDFVR